MHQAGPAGLQADRQQPNVIPHGLCKLHDEAKSTAHGDKKPCVRHVMPALHRAGSRCAAADHEQQHDLKHCAMLPHGNVICTL